MVEFKSSEYGYVPHAYQTKLVCPRCGNDIFDSPMQGISTDAPVWCYEFICTKCGHYIGVEVNRE